ncbi:MAG: BrnT family toxin [bacterium]
MKYFKWNEEKDVQLKQQRGLSFSDIVALIMGGGLLDVVPHPNPKKYPKQRMFVVEVDDYVYLVPFVETDDGVFLKTIIPSRKATGKYLGGEAI